MARRGSHTPAIAATQGPATNSALVIVGFTVLVLGFLSWVWPEDPRVTTVSEHSEGTRQTEATEAGTVTRGRHVDRNFLRNVSGGRASTGRAGNNTTDATGTVTRGPTSKTVSADPTGETTQTTEPEPSRRSETLTLAMVGTGALLLLAGFFAGRIHSITLPGGAGLELVSETAETASDLSESIHALEEATTKQNRAARAALAELAGTITSQKEAFQASLSALEARTRALEDAQEERRR